MTVRLPLARASAILALCALAGSLACRRGPAPPTDGRIAAWLDISPALGDPARDPGDALALLQAYGSGRLAVRGVSVTFGNVPLVRGYPAAVELLPRLDATLLRPWRGPSRPEERQAPTEATELLEAALERESMTVVAVGPLTTLASVLLRAPALAGQVERVILVGGQTPPTDPAMPLAPDPNVLADDGSLRALLETTVPITLVPADARTGLGFGAADLDALEAGQGPVRMVTSSARAWLTAVTARAGGTTFPVPSLLAIDVTAHPGEVRCEAAVARLARDEQGVARLWVSIGTEGRPVTWCHTADPGAKARILADIARVGPVK
ncbi:nucleoside hydrolase [Luteitalea sp.]|uniref:nucleoside hydrolase n=1 Tax=Luteitalea sp. TaxID=2004800 RepID=UPI0037C9A6A6